MQNFGITNPVVEQYIERLLPQRHPVLAEMEAYGYDQGFPIVGPLVGQFFAQVAVLSGAMRILELGSGFGYSAFWFAWATGPDVEIHCTEGDPDNAARAKEYLRRAKLDHKVTYHIGDALTLLRDEIEGDFDLIFCDIDKWEYPAALQAALPRLRDGGVLLWDNVLWSGKVAAKSEDEWTTAIQQFNTAAMGEARLRAHILPIRDGVLFAIKEAAPKKGRPAKT